MSFILGDTVRNLWTALDANNDPVSGLVETTDIVFTLHRDTGSAMVAASEDVTLTEIGVTGHYYCAFTPVNTGLYVLQLEELNVNTLQRTFRFADIEVLTAGSAFSPTYANAFCAETDIERWIQAPITSSTRPSSTEAAAFAEARASILASLTARWGYAVTPATVIAGSRLEDLLREANAIGAALDYTVAQQFASKPNLSDRPERLQALWEQYIGNAEIMGYLQLEIRGNLASLSTNHILSGDTVAYNEGAAPTNSPIGIGMGSLF